MVSILKQEALKHLEGQKDSPKASGGGSCTACNGAAESWVGLLLGTGKSQAGRGSMEKSIRRQGAYAPGTQIPRL